MKNRLNKKRILYTICFTLLGIIDFTRFTQQQNVWGPLVNCSGILLLMMVAGAYKLQEFSNRFTYIWSVVMLIMLLASIVWRDEHIFGIYKWTVFIAIINVWMIGVIAYRIIVKIFIEKSIKFRWNILTFLWVILTVLIMMSPSRSVWPLWYLTIFSLFYFTKFEKVDFAYLCEAMADGIILAFIILQIYAFGYRPYDQLRYYGAYSNCNITALHYLVTYVAILMKLHFLTQKNHAKVWKIISFIGAAVLLDFLIMTMGRTAWCVAAVLTILYGVLVVKKSWGINWRGVMARAVALLLSVIILFPVTFLAARWLPPLRHHPIWYAGEWNENKVHSFDPINSEKYTDFDELLEGIFKRINIFGKMSNPLVLRAQASEKDADRSITTVGPEGLAQSMRIRLGMYKAYLEDLNWVGHSSAEGHYWVADEGYYVWHPQNVWIQVAFYYGIPAGILFLVLTVLILIKQVYAINRRKSSCAFIPLFISAVFLIYGLTEIVWLVGQLILFLFFFVQHPQFTDESVLQHHAE